jgi:hypothetical protein
MSVELEQGTNNPWSDWMQQEREAAGAPQALPQATPSQWGGWRPPEGTPAPAEYWIPPTASFGDDPSGVTNRQNPFADPGRPFVQAGTTGGYQVGVGVTRGPGTSQTQAEYDAARAAAQGSKWASQLPEWLSRNPDDYHRFIDAMKSEWQGAGEGMTREQSEAMQRDPRMATSRPGGVPGQTWGGENWFTDPATNQLETLIKSQLNQLGNPGANDPQSKLMDFLMQRFQELSTSNGYSPQELAMLRTQGLEPIEDLRAASHQRQRERTAQAGYLPSSGLAEARHRDTDLDFDRLRTQASRDLAVQNVNERSNRLNQALQLGQTALNTQRGTQGQQLQLSTLLQQLPVQSLNQALAVLNGSSTPESLAQIVAQMNAQNQQQQQFNSYQQQQLWSGIGSALAELLRGGR